MSGIAKFAGIVFVVAICLSTPIVRELIALVAALVAIVWLARLVGYLIIGIAALVAAPFILAGSFVASLFDRS